MLHRCVWPGQERRLLPLYLMSVIAHLENILSKINLSHVTNLIIWHCVEKDSEAESKSMTEVTILKSGTSYRFKVERVTAEVFFSYLPLISLNCVQ